LAAVLGAMLLRHLGDEHPDAVLHRAINGAVGRQSYVFDGVDENFFEQYRAECEACNGGKPVCIPEPDAENGFHEHQQRPMKHELTVGALRAARAIQRDALLLKSLPELIDRETGIREVLEILENIIAEAGDLIEARSPKLAAQARAALRRYADETPRQAE
jgi:hypothetical protein